MAEFEDTLGRFRGRPFRLKHLDAGITVGDLQILRDTGLIEIDESLAGFNRVHDYLITPTGEEFLNRLDAIETSTIPNRDQYDAIVTNLEMIRDLPRGAGVEFEASEFNYNPKKFASLHEAGLIDVAVEREWSANTWETTDALTNTKNWI
ncbi:hypothetical protein [Natronoglomus mannanivorans]|uniref:Uncharacterized protein n=1 Tax=Natronoglomus mannanivorans TaxID=2979990 RepID=A0AAP2Z3V4_9EURY|nr:hypothetical protein [Halobacteria archaeon AArc-xg1-1]